MIEDAIYYLLANDATVAGLVGTRIFPGYAKEGTAVPYIVYSRISADHDESTEGSSGLGIARYQFSCVDDSMRGIAALAEAVRKELQDYTGTVASTCIHTVHAQGETDGSAVQETPGGETFLHVRECDFELWFDEDKPT
ncbi:MAG: DUF3168 domain-containing protein [Phycisphaerae bacterium]|nr:DUF3168 domain-containing protein [Phycisphaerae bacterium]